MSAEREGTTNRFPGPRDPPEAVHEVSIPEADVKGWLVVDRLVGGMAFGGFRISPHVTREEVCGLARAMSWKLGCHGSPVGGTKGGLVADPNDEKTPERLALFARACAAPLGTSVIVGKDMGATDALLDGLYGSLGHGQLAVARRVHGGAAVPERLRDLVGYRRHMTGLGVAWAARAAMGGDLRGCRLGIQGWGLVGVGTAHRAGGLGARVMALSDAHGCLLPAAGITPGDLVEGTHVKGVLPADVQGTREAREVLFEAEMDVLVLAASSHSVGLEDAERIRASVVVEGSNFGLTPEARSHLHQRGIPVVPDVVASSSSAAMVARQLAAANHLTSEALWEAIEAAITRGTSETLRISRETGMEPREAYLAWLREPS